MPQMSPIMWTLILIVSSASIIQINTFLFFEMTPQKSKNKKKNKSIEWKW
nr:ATP synthase F0 subunit 8 [Acanalonia sp.]